MNADIVRVIASYVNEVAVIYMIAVFSPQLFSTIRMKRFTQPRQLELIILLIIQYMLQQV